MGRRKKKDEGNPSSGPSDNVVQQKSTKQRKLPKIEQRQYQEAGTQHTKKGEKTQRHGTTKNDITEELHLPEIYDSKHSSRQLAYNQQPYSYHQATMEFAAKKFMRRQVAQEYRERMANLENEDDFERLNQLQKALENNCGEYNCLYTRDASMSVAERERELDQKRQTLLEMKDKQVKFFRKCRQENLDGQYLSSQASLSTERKSFREQKANSKPKKAKKERSTKQNDEATSKGVNPYELPRSNLTQHNHTETVLPNVQVKKPVDSRPWLPTSDFKSLDFRQPAREDPQLEWVGQRNRQNQMALPPLNPKANAGQPLPPICRKPHDAESWSAMLESRDLTNLPLKPIYQNQKDNTEDEVSFTGTMQHALPPSPVDDNKNGQRFMNVSPVSFAEFSSSESSEIELDTENILGIHSHVVTDEELRKELRLDLSFVRTPVKRKQARRQERQAEDDKNGHKSNKERKDNL